MLGLMAGTMLTACSSEKTQENIRIDTKPHQLSIDKDKISLGAKANSSAELKVTAENTGWEFTNIPSSWLAVKPSSGRTTTTVNITAQENTSVDETRVQVIQFHSTETDYNYSRDISVSQAAATVSITPNETSFGCEAAANSKTISIDANVEWDAESAESWLTLTKSKTQLTINIMENLGTSRTTTILLKRIGTTATVSTITVTQSEANVTGGTETLSFNVNGESKEVPITAGASWTAYTSDESWLSVTPAEGKTGAATLTISTTANASSATRSGFVYVKIGDDTKLSIPIQQDKMDIKIEGTPIQLNSNGQDLYQLNVISTSVWELLSKPEWVHLDPEKGDVGSVMIAVSAEKNSSIHSRSGKIKIGIPNTTIFAEVSVEQSGVETNDKNLIFGWSASQQILDIPFPNEWSAMSSADWITLSQYSGFGSGEIVISVSTNDKDDDRSASIIFVTESNSFTITVHQEGQYLKTDNRDAVISAMGGVINITVATTVGAQDYIEYEGETKDWIQVSREQEYNYKLTVEKNPSHYSRNATFRILPTLATTNSEAKAGVKLLITQSGRSISANVKKIGFFSQGGTSSVYTIQADGDYSMQKGSSDVWYILQHDALTKTFSIIASENSTDNTREGKLTLSLTNLPLGESCSIEIPIIQYNSGIYIDFEDYDKEQDWLE